MANESNCIYILSTNFAWLIISSGIPLHNCIDGIFTGIPRIKANFNILFISRKILKLVGNTVHGYILFNISSVCLCKKGG